MRTVNGKTMACCTRARKRYRTRSGGRAPAPGASNQAEQQDWILTGWTHNPASRGRAAQTGRYHDCQSIVDLRKAKLFHFVIPSEAEVPGSGNSIVEGAWFCDSFESVALRYGATIASAAAVSASCEVIWVQSRRVRTKAPVGIL